MHHQHEQLLEYIRKQMEHGSQPAHVRQALLTAGWEAGMVDELMAKYKSTAQPHHRQASHAAAHQPTQATATHQAQTQHQPQHAQHHQQATKVAAEPAEAEADEQYTVFRSVKESVRTFKANPRSLLLSTLVSFGVTGIVMGILAFLFVAQASDIRGLSQVREAIVPLSILLTIGGIASVILQAFMTGILAANFYDGASKEKPGFKDVLEEAVRNLGRVSLAILLGAAITIGPLVAAIVISGFLSLDTIAEPSDETSATSDITRVGISILLMIGTAVWAIIAGLRYALVPYVALLEPKTKLLKTLSRSHHLSKDGGQWFIFKGFLLYLLISIIIAAVLSPIVGDNTTGQMVTSIITIPVEVLAIGCMTMLYRNRRAVRGKSHQ